VRLALADVHHFHAFHQPEKAFSEREIFSFRPVVLSSGSQELWTARWSPDGRYVAALAEDYLLPIFSVFIRSVVLADKLLRAGLSRR